jgi:aminopeptidase
MRRLAARKPWTEWRFAKENAAKFTWTLALYGTSGLASEAKLSEEEYWGQIIKACFLDEPDPVAKWREVAGEIRAFKDKLNALPIDKLHVEGDDADLWVRLGEKRQWAGGGGRNIPSFEIFTSPDWRGTEGWIRFNQPLYVYGNIIRGVQLTFKEGRVIGAKADEGQTVLQNMIAEENADKIGEFSLTDSRHSRITKFMATTLFDENVGGQFGNTHLALGASYHDCYDGDPSKPNKEEWTRLGFNDSGVHTDIISTTDRTVTATLQDGSEKIIYRNGQFQL